MQEILMRIIYGKLLKTEFNPPQIALGTLAPALTAVFNQSIDSGGLPTDWTKANISPINKKGNKYLADEEPWKLIKTDTARTQTVLFVALQIVTALGVLSEPLLPFTAKRLKGILNIIPADTATERDQGLGWGDISTRETLLTPGHQINKSELLFRKIEDKEIEAQLRKLEATKQINQNEAMTPAPQKDTISYEDFAKLDLRVGTIIAAEKVPKTDKLLQLKVDTGLDVRTIVSGIAESFSPEEVIGKQVTVLVNLAPRKLRGVESQGMLLMAEAENGKLIFVGPDEDNSTNGIPIS